MSSVIELRQYTLHAGARETLIELFDREFVETQEAAGAEVLGQFRDLDDPDRFVWLRGFADMETRGRALADFYGGPVWKAHREAANATMIDSDNVLLLKPVGGLPRMARARAAAGAAAAPSAPLSLVVLHLAAAADDRFLAAFERDVAPAFAAQGTPVLARFVTETARNNFPPLPVREGERVFAYAAAAHGLPEWPAAIAQCFVRPPQHLRLMPTARSRWRL